MKQLHTDLSPDINSLTDLDIGVWNTPEGQTFIDGKFQGISLQSHSLLWLLVLSNKGNKAQAKGKDADLTKWDAEVRQSLAKKKSTTTPTLSKQEQSLLQAQIEKEAKIRSRMSEIKASLDRALQTISHLALGNIDDFRAYVSQIVGLLLSSGALDKGTLLVGSLAFTTLLVWPLPFRFSVLTLLQDVSRCCSDRLGTFGKWIGVAMLRSLEINCVPEELQAEPVNRKVFLRIHDIIILIVL